MPLSPKQKVTHEFFRHNVAWRRNRLCSHRAIDMKKHIKHTRYGAFIGFTGAELRQQPRNPVGRHASGITGGIEVCPAVSWAAQLLYRFGFRKLARCV